MEEQETQKEKDKEDEETIRGIFSALQKEVN